MTIVLKVVWFRGDACKNDQTASFTQLIHTLNALFKQVISSVASHSSLQFYLIYFIAYVFTLIGKWSF